MAAGSVRVVSRHTTFQLAADPSVEQERALARHEGAARFAFNQCLRLHLDARHQHTEDENTVGSVRVPWSWFDFINAFNAWKRSEQAGRRFVVDGAGDAGLEVTGLAWRGEVSAQVFEEAAVDLSKALRAWTDSRKGKRAGRKVGHPRFKKKTDRGSFRMRNKTAKGRVSIRVGEGHPRSVTLPGIGVVLVHDDTRRLRRMLAAGRARILFATVSRRAGRWRISLNVQASDLHPNLQHPARQAGDRGGWVGVDRGLHAPVVAARWWLASIPVTLRSSRTSRSWVLTSRFETWCRKCCLRLRILSWCRPRWATALRRFADPFFLRETALDRRRVVGCAVRVAFGATSTRTVWAPSAVAATTGACRPRSTPTHPPRSPA